MGTSQNDGDKTPTPPDKSTVILMLGTMVDTTWRMFVPTIGLMLVGLWIDQKFHTTPLLAFTGLVAGAALAYALVRRQIKRVKR